MGGDKNSGYPNVYWGLVIIAGILMGIAVNSCKIEQHSREALEILRKTSQ